MSRGEGPICRRTKLVAASLVGLKGAFMGCSFGSSGRVRLVGGLIHQLAELAFVGDLHLEKPGLALRIRIDQRRLRTELLVHFQYFARNRCVDVGGGFDGFHDGRGVSLLQRAADLGQVDKNDVSELLLRVIGDPHRCNIALDAEPFVVGGEERSHGMSFSAYRCWERTAWRRRARAGAARALRRIAACRWPKARWAHSPSR